jgi:putative transcriptional regulator
MKTKRKQSEVEIDNLGDALIASMSEGVDLLQKGKLSSLRKIEGKLPAPVESISRKEVRAIREQLGASQAVMARLINVPQRTWVSWESGDRKPSGAALKLLDIARKRPQTLIEA